MGNRGWSQPVVNGKHIEGRIIPPHPRLGTVGIVSQSCDEEPINDRRTNPCTTTLHRLVLCCTVNTTHAHHFHCKSPKLPLTRSHLQDRPKSPPTYCTLWIAVCRGLWWRRFVFSVLSIINHVSCVVSAEWVRAERPDSRHPHLCLPPSKFPPQVALLYT